MPWVRSATGAFIIAAATAATIARGDAPAHSAATAAPPSDSAVTVLAAGDVAACWLSGAKETARILDRNPGTILVVGDAAYKSTHAPDPLRQCYDPTWGRFRDRTYAVPGNHEYESGQIGEFFDYFGAHAGPNGLGYFSFDVGSWHVVALNSNIAMDASSAEGRWLAADLAQHRSRCTLAFFHHPRFTSGLHGGRHRMVPLWAMLQRAGVDVAISGHDHIYERFAPMTADGKRSNAGIRQFVVGTGGGLHAGIGAITANSESHATNTWGVLKLDLQPDGYVWRFISTGTFADSGSGACH